MFFNKNCTFIPTEDCLSILFEAVEKKSNQFNALCNLQLYYSEIQTITY